MSWFLFLLLKFPSEPQLIWLRPYPCQALTRPPSFNDLDSHLCQLDPPEIEMLPLLLILPHSLPLLNSYPIDYQTTLTVGVSHTGPGILWFKLLAMFLGTNLIDHSEYLVKLSWTPYIALSQYHIAGEPLRLIGGKSLRKQQLQT